MGRIGNRAKGSTTYLYTQGSTGSTAVGVDSTDSDKFKIFADPAAGATPETGSQLSIDPSTDGDVVVDPNGEGKLQLASGNFDIPLTSSATQGVITVNGTRFIHSRNGAVTGCTFVGQGSGNFTLTGNSNTGLGQNTLPDLTNGQQNTALGNNTLEQLNTGTGNVAIGTGCLNTITTASNNTYIGRLVSGGAAFNGSNNVVIKAGSTLGQILQTGAESNNVLIQNVGAIGESNTLRIGTTGAGSGQQSRAFIAGINGVNVGSVASVLTNSGDQLGTATITAGSNVTVTPGANTITIAAGSAAIVSNLVTVVFGQSPYSALATDYYISCDVTGGAIIIRLPNAPSAGRVFVVKDREGLAAISNITVTTVGGVVNIDGSTSFVMNTAHQSAMFIFGALGYEVF